jgi:hypothetical protein
VGEGDRNGFQPTFNRSIFVESRPERLTQNAGALMLREIDDRLGWTRLLTQELLDPRDQRLITHPFSELLRTRLYLIAQGWKDQDDADFLRNDAALRLAVSERKAESPLRTVGDGLLPFVPDGLSSQPTQSRLIETLALEQNVRKLNDLLAKAVGAAISAKRGHRFQNATLDVDSFPVRVHGQQAGSAYNGHYRDRVYHPLIATIAETGDVVGGDLRPGNVHTADGLLDFLLPLIDRVEHDICVVSAVRGDAGMPCEATLAALEHRKIGYCFRLRDNVALDRLTNPFLKRSVGRPANYERPFCHEISYQAKTWSTPRRVVLVVLDRPGQCILDYFFLITNWLPDQMSGDELLEFYRKRGTHEGIIGELKSAMEVALPCTTRPKTQYDGSLKWEPMGARSEELIFACNHATLLVFAWSYNLINQLRLLAEKAHPQDRGPASEERDGGWSIARVRQRLLLAPARFILHARRVIAVLQESVAELWNGIGRLLSFRSRLALYDS